MYILVMNAKAQSLKISVNYCILCKNYIIKILSSLLSKTLKITVYMAYILYHDLIPLMCVSRVWTMLYC